MGGRAKADPGAGARDCTGVRKDYWREDLQEFQHKVDGMNVNTSNIDDELLDNFVHSFYGYGNFHGNYLFIGMEEGRGKSYQEVSQRLSTWSTRGRRELEDVAEFHRGSHPVRL
jgi:hypothetical protein